MTYSELVDLVKDYLEVDETTFNANIDTFIKLAEEDICRKVAVPAARKSSTANLTINDRYLALPTDFLAPYELMVNTTGTTWVHLIRKDVSYMREAYPSTASTGIPKYYSMFDDDTLILGPTPGSAYGMELHYYGMPDSVVDTSPSWLSTNAENALLYGTVLMGYVYLKGSADMIGMYKEAYDQAVNNLSTLVEGMQKKDEYRHGSRRIPA
jgi:hypothetical protein